MSCRNEHEDAKDAAKWIEEAGVKHILLPGDLADEAVCQEWIDKTISQLGGGYVAYGVALLVVEIMGATTVVNYGMNLLFNPMHEKFPEDPDSPGMALGPSLHIALPSSNLLPTTV